MYVPKISEAFGLATLFRSGAAMLATIACLRYEAAIVLPKRDDDAAQLFVICGLVLMAITTLTAILTYVFGPRLLYPRKARIEFNIECFTPIPAYWHTDLWRSSAA
jgi:hypothetical protein